MNEPDRQTTPCTYRVEDKGATWTCVREDGHDLPHRTVRHKQVSSPCDRRCDVHGCDDTLTCMADPALSAGREATCPTCGGSGDLGSYYAPVPCGACDASGTVEGRQTTGTCGLSTCDRPAVGVRCPEHARVAANTFAGRETSLREEQRKRLLTNPASPENDRAQDAHDEAWASAPARKTTDGED